MGTKTSNKLKWVILVALNLISTPRAFSADCAILLSEEFKQERSIQSWLRRVHFDITEQTSRNQSKVDQSKLVKGIDVKVLDQLERIVDQASLPNDLRGSAYVAFEEMWNIMEDSRESLSQKLAYTHFDIHLLIEEIDTSFTSIHQIESQQRVLSLLRNLRMLPLFRLNSYRINLLIGDLLTFLRYESAQIARDGGRNFHRKIWMSLKRTLLVFQLQRERLSLTPDSALNLNWLNRCPGVQESLLLIQNLIDNLPLLTHNISRADLESLRKTLLNGDSMLTYEARIAAYALSEELHEIHSLNFGFQSHAP